MCFLKRKVQTVVAIQPQQIEAVQQQKELVRRQEADASLTKTSQNQSNVRGGYEQNIKTSVVGLEDEPTTSKKRLLGE